MSCWYRNKQLHLCFSLWAPLLYPSGARRSLWARWLSLSLSLRQITQQSLVSRWYEMRARSSQNLLSSDWTLASKIVGRGGRKARRLSLTRTPALFPLFRRRRRHFLDCTTQTKESDAVSVNNPPAFKNSKSGLRCATEEPMFKSVSLS